MTGRKRKGRGTKNVPLLLIALPGLAYLLINNYIPMFGIFLAFKSYDFSKGVFGSPWCGFDNFKFLFKTKDALIMTRNTILYNFAFIVIGTALGIFVAILLTEIVKSVWAKFYQSALLLPYLLSWVVISYMVFAFLNSDSGFSTTIQRETKLFLGADNEETAELTVPMYDFGDWASRMKAYRKKNHITQQELAQLMGVKHFTLRSWEQKQAKPPYNVWRLHKHLFDDSIKLT